MYYGSFFSRLRHVTLSYIAGLSLGIEHRGLHNLVEGVPLNSLRHVPVDSAVCLGVFLAFGSHRGLSNVVHGSDFLVMTSLFNFY